MRTMTPHVPTRTRMAQLFVPLLLIGAAAAQDADPPGRVARLGYTQGEVSELAGLSDWATVEFNRPITSGDKIWSDADSRVELIWLGGGAPGNLDRLRSSTSTTRAHRCR